MADLIALGSWLALLASVGCVFYLWVADLSAPVEPGDIRFVHWTTALITVVVLICSTYAGGT